MSWSKVKGWPPLGWWYHKILCEFGYWYEQTFNSIWGMGTYYHHLNMMCDKYGINLYGQKYPK